MMDFYGFVPFDLSMSHSIQQDFPLKEYLDRAVEVAQEAGALIANAFHSRQSNQSQNLIDDLKDNNDANLVTVTDRAVEALCFNALRSSFPSHTFIGEESTSESVSDQGLKLTDNPTWIIDPIDGTTNFVHGFPFCCVSIGLVIRHIPVVGVIYNPILNEMYTAASGHGAFLNGTPIRQSPPKSYKPLSQSIISCEFGNERTDAILDPKLETIRKIVKAPSRALRCVGSACLNMCLTARGILDVYFEAGIHCWDITAGIVIVRYAFFIRFISTEKLEASWEITMKSREWILWTALLLHFDQESRNM